jgi:hypothetical protein
MASIVSFLSFLPKTHECDFCRNRLEFSGLVHRLILLILIFQTLFLSIDKCSVGPPAAGDEKVMAYINYGGDCSLLVRRHHGSTTAEFRRILLFITIVMYY